MNYVLNDRQFCDLEMILNGGYEPLKGFLNQKDYQSVINNTCLSDGTVWSIPITLSVSVSNININNKPDIINLFYDDKKVAILNVEDIYEPDIKLECLKTLGTTDDNHPYVSYLYSLGNVYNIGGTLIKTEDIYHYDFPQYRLSPSALKN